MGDTRAYEGKQLLLFGEKFNRAAPPYDGSPTKVFAQAEVVAQGMFEISLNSVWGVWQFKNKYYILQPTLLQVSSSFCERKTCFCAYFGETFLCVVLFR